MQRVERQATIGAPPREVFAFLADLDNLGVWQTGVVSATVATPGEIGVGTRVELIRDVMGQRIQAPLTVTDYVPPSRLGIESRVSGVAARGLLELAAADGGAATDLRFSMEIKGSMLSSFLEPMIARAAQSDVDASIDRIQSRFGR